MADGLVHALQLAENGRRAEAMKALQSLFKEYPQDRRIQAYAHFIRGREYESAGDVGNARAEYQRALAIDSSLEAARRSMVGLRSGATPGENHKR